MADKLVASLIPLSGPLPTLQLIDGAGWFQSFQSEDKIAVCSALKLHKGREMLTISVYL